MRENTIQDENVKNSVRRRHLTITIYHGNEQISNVEGVGFNIKLYLLLFKILRNIKIQNS